MALCGIGVVSIDRIADFIQSMTQGVICIATGAVYGFCRSFSERATSSILDIEARLMTKNVIHTDETVVLVNGVQSYIRHVSHLLFLHDFAVSFDKNMSERDLRKCKNRQKMSGSFRTQEGSSMYGDILSIIETAKRIHLNPFDMISRVLQGKSCFGVEERGEL